MSKRRKLGDIVKKRAGAGFIGEPLIIKLVHLGPTDDVSNPAAEPCYMCDDDSCWAWVNVQVIVDGKETEDYCYHVSECEMEDLDVPPDSSAA